MRKLLDWLDHRTGYKAVAQHALYESVPGGARWRYVWGSTLTFALADFDVIERRKRARDNHKRYDDEH